MAPPKRFKYGRTNLKIVYVIVKKEMLIRKTAVYINIKSKTKKKNKYLPTYTRLIVM